jgi:hypothetical protein
MKILKLINCWNLALIYQKNDNKNNLLNNDETSKNDKKNKKK